MAVLVAIAVLLVVTVIVVPVVIAIATTITAPVMADSMMFLVMRNVFVLVPVVVNKIDTLATGVVLAAMFAPVPCVAGRDVQVDWGTMNRNPLDDHWVTIKDTWRRIAIPNVDLSIETGLTDADGYADIGCESLRSGSGKRCSEK
jgi:hypothetical protein